MSGATRGPLPKVTSAILQLHTVDEPMALVPVRTIVPDFIFLVYGALTRSGVTPVMITWGADQEKGEFRLEKMETRPGKLALFTVPKLYIKTTLVTMDGLIDRQPARVPRAGPKPSHVDHSVQPPARSMPGTGY